MIGDDTEWGATTYLFTVEFLFSRCDWDIEFIPLFWGETLGGYIPGGDMGGGSGGDTGGGSGGDPGGGGGGGYSPGGGNNTTLSDVSNKDTGKVWWWGRDGIRDCLFTYALSTLSDKEKNIWEGKEEIETTRTFYMTKM